MTRELNSFSFLVFFLFQKNKAQEFNCSCSQSTIKSSWTKAKEILNYDTTITAALVKGVAKMVKSKSNPTWPCLIQIVNGNKDVYDENCLMWASIRVCSLILLLYPVLLSSNHLSYYNRNLYSNY